MDITCQTLSLDRVFLHMTVTVFFRISAHRSYEAHYSLQNPREMIESCVLDAVQSIAPEMSLDELYASPQRIADFCYERLGTHLLDHGFETSRILVQRIEPTRVVREAMDETAASRALKSAAVHAGEANKMEIVKHAEGAAERHYLMGVAISKARKAMVDQMQESAALFADVDVRIRTPPSTSEIMKILLVAQYMDVLEVVNPDGVMVEPEPKALNQIRDRLAT